MIDPTPTEGVPMTAQFYYTRDTSRGTESIVVSGEVVRTVPSSHPNFIRIRDYCFAQDSAGQPIDMDHVLSLHDVAGSINDELLRVTDRVSFKGGKLLWDGEPAEGALAAHIVRMIKNRDDNYVAFARFMEKLAQNPSEVSRAALFEWIADRDWTITEDGDFIGYKGVNADYTSKQRGYGIVNGVEHDGNLDNTPGNVVEVPRNRVDADRESACSYGLHVGTRSFAEGWSGNGGKMILLAVNPRDVVMVPRDGGGQKMRVCRYVVLGDNEQELKVTTYRGNHRADDGETAEEESSFYDNLCEECDCILDDGSCPCGCNAEVCDGCGTVETECFCDEADDGVEKCSDCNRDLDINSQCSYCDCLDCGELKEDCVCDLCEECECDPCECCPDCGEYECVCDEDEAEDFVTSFLTPYGRCEYDNAPLDANGKCTKYPPYPFFN